jgi:hypothetical protein
LHFQETGLADIIPLNSRRLQNHRRNRVQSHQRKILAVQKFFQCASCAFKCERCGSPIQTASEGDGNSDRMPPERYRFCASCQEEYQDYLQQTEGNHSPRHYWHNEEWLKVWHGWLSYHRAIDRYLKSDEFQHLLREIRQLEPDH